MVLTCDVAQSCPTLCDPMDCSLPGSSIHGIFQARVLEWVAISFSRGSSQPSDLTRVSHTPGRHFTVWATREPPSGPRKPLIGIFLFFLKASEPYTFGAPRKQKANCLLRKTEAWAHLLKPIYFFFLSFFFFFFKTSNQRNWSSKQNQLKFLTEMRLG